MNNLQDTHSGEYLGRWKTAVLSTSFLTYYFDSWPEEIMLLTVQGQVPRR